MKKSVTGVLNWRICIRIFLHNMSEETDTSIEGLRRSQRRELNISRREKRYQASTVQRTGATKELLDITALATSVKKKKGVNRELLEELSQALGLSQQNAAIFLQTDGALQALCSFLTGYYYSYLILYDYSTLSILLFN